MGKAEEISASDYEQAADRVARSLLNGLQTVASLEAAARSVPDDVFPDIAPVIHGAFAAVVRFALNDADADLTAAFRTWACDLINEGCDAHLSTLDTIGPVQGVA